MGFGATLARFKWIILGLCAVIVLAASVIIGLNYYLYRKTPEFSYAKIQSALQSGNIQQLAYLVDFRPISEHLAAETARAFPFFQEGPKQIVKISNILQGQALKAFRLKNVPNDDAKITDPEELLKKPLYLLPPDILAQLAKNLTLQKKGAEAAVLTSSFEHPLFKRKFPLVFALREINGLWKVTDVLNAHELVTTLKNLLEERLQAGRDLYFAKMDKIVKTMHETLEIQSCTAEAGLISDHKTLLVVVQILARNKTGLTIKNVNATTPIFGQKGQLLLSRQLSSTEATPPSSDFSHTWTIELDGNSELGRKVLASGPLTCKPTWRTMTMSNARVYHAIAPEKKLGPCPKHKNHLEGLCELEIFK
ncbi:MAG: hypothetical protein IJS50_04095 [Desulfovibrio sp.]|nr:hypothetical protein [Desulfovibrio sp.]